MRQRLTMLAGVAFLAMAASAQASPFERQTTGQRSATGAAVGAAAGAVVGGAGGFIYDQADRAGD